MAPLILPLWVTPFFALVALVAYLMFERGIKYLRASKLVEYVIISALRKLLIDLLLLLVTFLDTRVMGQAEKCEHLYRGMAFVK